MKRAFFSLCLLSILLPVGCRKQEELPVPTAPEKKAGTPDANLATAPVNYLAASVRAEQSMEKTVDAVAINNAIQLFAVQEGRLPKDLNELVSKKYLKKLPVPPFGSKLQYDAKEGKATVVKE
jgi:hypothetical protein